MHPAVQAVGRLRIDTAGVQNQAAESRLDMAARAAEPVIEVEMAEGGVEIVAPQQADHPAAEPDAFGIAGRAGDHALGFGKFVDFLRLLAGFLAGRRGWSGGLSIGALGEAPDIEGNRSGEQPESGAQSAGNAKHTMGHGST